MFKTKFLIEINYKSGIQKQFWVYEFNINGGDWSWTSVNASNSPIRLNVDEVESVWQISYKKFGFV